MNSTKLTRANLYSFNRTRSVNGRSRNVADVLSLNEFLLNTGAYESINGTTASESHRTDGNEYSSVTSTLQSSVQCYNIQSPDYEHPDAADSTLQQEPTVYDHLQ